MASSCVAQLKGAQLSGALYVMQNDPEDYVRSADVESSPDADTPRPVGIKLLLAMLERGEDPIAALLLEITVRLMVRHFFFPRLSSCFLRSAEHSLFHLACWLISAMRASIIDIEVLWVCALVLPARGRLIVMRVATEIFGGGVGSSSGP
jgi:hypothetical protein